MTVVTIRPTSTTSSAGVSATGAASLHAATSDDSDSSYIDFDSNADNVLFGMGDVTLPAAAVVTRAAFRLRVAKVSGTANVFNVAVDWGVDGSVEGAAAVNWTSATTITAYEESLALSETGIDAAALRFTVQASGHTVRLYEVYIDVTYVAKPATVVATPTGTVTTTNKPQVAWANTLDSDGGAQTAYQVKFYTAAEYGGGGFDPDTTTVTTTQSGVTTGSATTWTPSATLADGTYRAYVRVAQTVNGTYHWSDWAYTAFTTLVDLPAVPTLTLTAENTGGRIKIDSIHNAGTATTTANEIQRSVDNVTWEPLRLTTDTDGVTYSPDATVYDYEAGNGQTVYYRARALHDYSGVFAASAWATANTSWSSTAWWLKCPLSPVLNTLVYPHAVESFTRRARQGIFQALGASEAIVVSDTREARTGQITLRLDTDEEIVALDALLDSGETLLLNAPAGDHFPDRYVALGDLDRERIADKAFIEGTLDSLQWTEVVVAAGVVDAWPTGLAPSETLAPSTSLAPAA